MGYSTASTSKGLLSLFRAAGSATCFFSCHMTSRLCCVQDQEAMRKAILEEVAPDQLPEQYGGTCKTPLYESQYERELAQHVQRVSGTAAAGSPGSDASGSPAVAAASAGVEAGVA